MIECTRLTNVTNAAIMLVRVSTLLSVDGDGDCFSHGDDIVMTVRKAMMEVKI